MKNKNLIAKNDMKRCIQIQNEMDNLDNDISDDEYEDYEGDDEEYENSSIYNDTDISDNDTDSYNYISDSDK